MAGADHALLERARVARHIQRAEELAGASDLSRLDRTQRLVRQLLLEELERYRREGRFPHNHHGAAQTPVFVDEHGTRCAVAHLMEASGEAELVGRIARARNRARIHELTDEPRLKAWLAAAGLSVEEAAAIQPQYCRTTSDCVCGAGFSGVAYPVPASGVIEAVVVQGQTARVEAIHGATAGVQVGDQIQVQVYGVQTAPGTRVLAPVRAGASSGQADAGAPVYPAIALGSDATFACSPQTPALTARQFIDAVTSGNCAQKLASYSSKWSQKQGCDGNPLDSGCGVSPGSAAAAAAAPTSLGLLLALVTVLLARRK